MFLLWWLREKYLALFHHTHQNNVIFVLCFQTNSKLFCNFFYWQVHGLTIVHLCLWRLENNNSKASISWTSTKIKVDHLSKALSLWCFIITHLSFVNITKALYNPILIHCASIKRNSIESISTSSLPPTHINVYFKKF
jgi:hypothetical protein